MTIAADARLSEQQKADRQNEIEKKKRTAALVRKDLNETFATPCGKRALRYLMDLCGYQQSSVVADPATGDPLANGTIYNAARVNVYLALRKQLHRDIVIPVENDGLDDDDSSVDLLS